MGRLFSRRTHCDRSWSTISLSGIGGGVLLALTVCSQIAFSHPPAAGRIRGRVLFTGPIPKLVEAKCSSPEACGKSKSYDRLALASDRGVANTLIYLKNVSGVRSKDEHTIHQTRCEFLPHITIAAPGSSIVFQNDDPVLHNCHGYYVSDKGGNDGRTTAFNIAQPVKGQRTAEQLRKPGLISVECDAGHSWMSAWIWVTESPYAAITDERGDFRLDGVPPGTYTLVMWHEGWTMPGLKNNRPTFSSPIREERQIVVAKGDVITQNFELH